MTPNTMMYMVAGYAVILVGITSYIVSLVIRNRKAAKELQALEARKKTNL